jgi:hypothetical protein
VIWVHVLPGVLTAFYVKRRQGRFYGIATP